MFSSFFKSNFFKSKNQKLVQKWIAEHEQIVILAHKIIAAYSNNDYDTAKKELQALNSLAVDHLMHEDIEFYRLLKDQKKLDIQTKRYIKEFTKTFRGTKTTLIHFLTKYSQPNTPLDEEFITTFNQLVGILGERIAFEETNLYSILNAR